jgi:hypothetical protein
MLVVPRLWLIKPLNNLSVVMSQGQHFIFSSSMIMHGTRSCRISYGPRINKRIHSLYSFFFLDHFVCNISFLIFSHFDIIWLCSKIACARTYVVNACMLNLMLAFQSFHWVIIYTLSYGMEISIKKS